MSRIAAVLALLVASSVCFAQERTATLTPEEAKALIDNLQPGEKRRIAIREENAVGVGAGLSTNADNADIKGFNSSAPAANAGSQGSGATGGSLEASLSVFSGKDIVWPFVIAGGAGIAFGIWRLRSGKLHDGVTAIGVGATLVVIGLWPEVLAWAVLAGVAVLGYGWWANSRTAGKATTKANDAEEKFKRAYEAARAVVGGVASLPADIQAAVKAEIAKQADDADKAVIKKIKREDGLA